MHVSYLYLLFLWGFVCGIVQRTSSSKIRVDQSMWIHQTVGTGGGPEQSQSWSTTQIPTQNMLFPNTSLPSEPLQRSPCAERFMTYRLHGMLVVYQSVHVFSWEMQLRLRSYWKSVFWFTTSTCFEHSMFWDIPPADWAGTHVLNRAVLLCFEASLWIHVPIELIVNNLCNKWTVQSFSLRMYRTAVRT